MLRIKANLPCGQSLRSVVINVDRDQLRVTPSIDGGRT